ncbi:SET domain-containing protein [Thelephora ganbajun]|uniref:SET domain-containing protein n=1 Tax=Thelephora ganbajun TaxID=370292 RepID=A0ACB6ZUI5_THEGA|nr:SET domain-containing protein [Thelephora ganbajun]
MQSHSDHGGVDEGDAQVCRWSELLSWLESHGMDLSPSAFHVERRPRPDADYGLFLTSPCPSLDSLFVVPSSALVNVKTLAPLYPGGKHLSAHQLISLHLCLHKPPSDTKESTDNLFGPFISILPREFDSHPLTWLVHKNLGYENELKSTFLALLPCSTRSALDVMAERFTRDLCAVTKYLINFVQYASGRPGELNTRNYLWAWLNVNTRCIYYRIKEKRTDEANVTLCPILDFANHNWHRSHIQPVSDSEIWNTRSKVKDAFQFLTTEHITEVEVDGEVYLRYGAHSNQSLFVEYGFVNVVSNEDMESGTYPAEVDVQPIVVGLFNGRGNIGTWMQTILENEGYWGDWTLSTSPNPAAPSFRLITALRLFAIGSEMTCVPTVDEEDVVCKPWRDTLLGITDTTSPDNEAKWRTTLATICNLVVEEGTTGLQRTLSSRFDEQNHSWSSWIRNNIAFLWSEQIVVAGAVLQSLEDGIEF